MLKYDAEEMVERLCAFEGKVQVQTLFMSGEYQGKSVDNTADVYVQPWLKALARIRPEAVYIYTIDRETPAKGLRKASPEVLDAIGERVKALGLECSVSY